jgi:hypothetical protein
MFVGYARISTTDQTLDLQHDALTKAGWPRPNSRVTSRQIDQRSGSALTPASLEATAHDPYVTSGVLWVSVSKVILHHRRMIAAEVQRRVPDSSAS